jgi:hypothetical protein
MSVRRIRVPLLCTAGYLAAVVAGWLVDTRPPAGCGWGKGGRHELATLAAGAVGLIGLLSLVACWVVAGTAAPGTGRRAVAVWGTGILAVVLGCLALAAVQPPYC